MMMMQSKSRTVKKKPSSKKTTSGTRCFVDIPIVSSSSSSLPSCSLIRVGFPADGSSTMPPICSSCKKGKNRTKYECRVKLGHTALPWSPIYVCITIDKQSCIGHDGRLVLARHPETTNITRLMCNYYVRNPRCVPIEVAPPIIPQPEGTTVDLASTVCKTCRKKHLTKKHCRGVLHHRYVPYCTTFHKMTFDQESTSTTEISNNTRATALTSSSIGNTTGTSIITNVNHKSDQEAFEEMLENIMNARTQNTKKRKDPPEQGKKSSHNPNVGISSTFFDGKIPESRMFLAKVSAEEVLYEVRYNVE